MEDESLKTLHNSRDEFPEVSANEMVVNYTAPKLEVHGLEKLGRFFRLQAERFKVLRERSHLNICVTGNTGAGKSSLMNSLCTVDLTGHDPENEVNHRAFEENKEFNVLLVGSTRVGKTSLVNVDLTGYDPLYEVNHRAFEEDKEFKVPVVGSTGVGKTSFVNVVLTCYDPLYEVNHRAFEEDKWCKLLKERSIGKYCVIGDIGSGQGSERAVNRRLFKKNNRLTEQLAYEVKLYFDRLEKQDGPLRSQAGFSGPDKGLSNSPGRKSIRISGVYASDPRNKGDQVFKMEHSALQQPGNQWNVEVKYRKRGNKAAETRWNNVWDFYPDATIKVKHNHIELTIRSVEEGHEFAVFGTPETSDKKRMQMAIFGGKPTQGKDWNIHVILFDDTMIAFKHVCEREESKGRHLLTTLAGLFVSNSDEDIKIDMSGFEQGWQIKGRKVKTIKSKDAWNSPENSIDFPSCVFEIVHVDETKQSFFCGITASHLNDTADTEVVAFFEQKNDVNLTDRGTMASHRLTIHEDNVIEVFAFLQMLIFFASSFTGAGVNPHP